MSRKRQEQLIQICKIPERKSSLYSLVALPWCCITPVVISWLGTGSAFVAALFRPITLPLLTASFVLLGYSHYRVWVKKHRSRPQLFWLTVSTLLSAGFWSWSILVMGALL